MKRSGLLAATAVCFLLAFPITAYSQGDMGGPPPGGSPPGAQQDPQMTADHKAEQELELKDRKSEMELKITNQMAELEKSKACIEAATSMEALHSCMPRGGSRGMMMGGPGGPMQGGPGGNMMGGPVGGMQGGQGGGMRPPPGGMGGQGPQ